MYLKAFKDKKKNIIIMKIYVTNTEFGQDKQSGHCNLGGKKAKAINWKRAKEI